MPDEKSNPNAAPDAWQQAAQTYDPKVFGGDGASGEEGGGEEKPGFFKRAGQALGIPTSSEELDSAAEEARPKADLDTAGRVLGGPAYTMGKGLYEYGKRAAKGFGEGVHEAVDAGENVAEGGPVGANIGKAGYGAMHALYSAIPFVGAPAEKVGEDIHEGNYEGAAGGALGTMMQPVIAKGMEKFGGKMANDGTPPPPEVAARNMTRAIVPAPNEWNSHIEATQAEAGNIQAFAKQNNMPLKTPLDWSNAAKAAADDANGKFTKDILGPHDKEPVSVAGANYQGKAVGETNNSATLGDINKRITTINDELRNAYAKKETGQTRTALASDADLKAEKQALTDILHKELGSRTGVPPEQIAALRQRIGRQYTIADQTKAAVNQRQYGVSKENEGSQAGAPGSKTGVVMKGINKLRGGPEGISNRAFNKALKGTSGIPAIGMPEVNPPTSGPAPRTPAWMMKDRLKQYGEP